MTADTSGPPGPAATATPPGTGGAPPGGSLVRSSAVMAVGTVASRLTGFLRTTVIAAALGLGVVGDAYNVAYALPFVVYELLLGGVLTSSVVPLLVRADARGRGAGEDYANRLLTVVAVGLGGVSLLAVLAAPLVIRLYAQGERAELATTFARLMFASIVFYGLSAVLGAVLNTRGRFAVPMWAPVANNLVVTATGLAVLLAGSVTADTAPTGDVVLLSAGVVAGIVVQVVALVLALRRTGFRLRPRLDLRGAGLGEAARLGSWMLLYVAAGQLAYLVVVQLAGAAGAAAPGRGYSSYVNAFVVFSLPHAVVTVSVITALLPQLSRAAAAGRLAELGADVGRGLRLAAVVLVPAAAFFLVLGSSVAVAIFDHGRTSAPEARHVGLVLTAFAVGLVPFSAYQLQLRAFYALRDTRTAALVHVGVQAVLVVADLALYAALPPPLRVVGLALGFATAYTVGLAVSTWLLRRRLGELDTARVVQVVVRLAVAAVLGGAVAALAAAGLRATAGTGPAAATLTAAVGGLLGGAAYLAAAQRMRVPEVAEVTGGLTRRWPRRSRARG